MLHSDVDTTVVFVIHHLNVALNFSTDKL